MPQIALTGISKTYQVGDERIDAVRSVSLEIEQGDFISIVGHSGSGKTTLLSMIGGITRPSSGSIVFEGSDICTMSGDRISDYRAHKIGFMFQFASLLPMLTVKENLQLPTVFMQGSVSGSSMPEKKAEELLDMVGLADKAKAYPRHLSGGQQRRVAIARAFMNAPALILADEPTGDLDEETELEMMKIFQTMNREKNITFIMVTHNTDLAKMTKRHFRMHQGTFQAQ